MGSIAVEKQDRSFEYKVPNWFLCSNVKTRQELHKATTQVALVDHGTTPAQPQDSDLCEKKVQMKETTTTYTISHDLYSDLHDTIAAAFIPNRQGELSYSQSTILLRSLLEENTEYIDLLVENLAKDLGAHLIAVDLEDLGDIGQEFDLQESLKVKEEKAKIDSQGETTEGSKVDTSEQPDRDSSTGFAEFYFASRTERHGSTESLARNKASVFGVLRSPKLKSEKLAMDGQIDVQKVQDKSPILLHIRDTNEIMDVSKGYRYFSRFSQFVREFRENGEENLMVVSISKARDPFSTSCDHGKPCATCTTYAEDRLVRKIRTDAASTIDIPISEGNKDMVNSEKKDCNRTKDLNIRHLKRALRTSIPTSLSTDLIEPPVAWNLEEASPILKFLKSALLGEDDIKRASKQIVGRTRGKSSLELEDIFAVLGRLRRTAQSKIQQKSAENTASDSASDKSEEPIAETPTWSKRLDDIRGDCTDTEKELLANVVDPEKLHSTYDDVIIDDEVKEIIKQLISMSRFSVEGESHHLLSQIQVKGALFYGPPGTGKTYFCRAMARESGTTMLAIDAASIISRWVGESEKYIKAAFSLSAKLYPCILFIDEVGSMFYRRSSDDKSYMRRALNQFLQEMDGLSSNKQAPFVVGATNQPSDIDEAFLRRLPQKVLFKLPNLESRIKILKVFLKDGDLDPLVSIEALAEKTEGYSGSDLRSICGQAALSWAMEQAALKRESGDEATPVRLKLTVGHFVKALERTMPSVSQRSMEDIDRFSVRFNQQASKSPTPVPPKPTAMQSQSMTSFSDLNLTSELLWNPSNRDEIRRLRDKWGKKLE